MSASSLLVIGSLISNSVKTIQNFGTNDLGNVASSVSAATAIYNAIDLFSKIDLTPEQKLVGNRSKWSASHSFWSSHATLPTH